MAHRYNSQKKTVVFKVGDTVSLRIPRIDRTNSDLPCLPYIVVEVKGEARNLYRIRYMYVHLSLACFYSIHSCMNLICVCLTMQCVIIHDHLNFQACKWSFEAAELEPHSGGLSFGIDDWKNAPMLSLREPAKKNAPWNAFVDNICSCTTGCSTRRCRCFAQGISCSSHCHGGRSCSNKKYEDK